MPCARNSLYGFTIVELLVATALAALLLAAMSGLVSNVIDVDDVVTERNELLRDARFATERMARAVGESRNLLLPTPDKPDTNWRENVREQTVPASPPEGDSTLATAVLAISLSASVDLDADGFPDADNDRDGRIDEDYPQDITNDLSSGIHLIDDGGDGSVDESTSDNDDDERLNGNDEDPLNGVDDDVDGVIDEDPGADMNGDGAPGIVSVDDDHDGNVDEGDVADDDEDGSIDEDWLDVVVFYLQGDSLVERHPVPWDETASGGVTGRDVVTSVIADNVTRFRVERMPQPTSTTQLISIELELTAPGGEAVSVARIIRVGGAL